MKGSCQNGTNVIKIYSVCLDDKLHIKCQIEKVSMMIIFCAVWRLSGVLPL